MLPSFEGLITRDDIIEIAETEKLILQDDIRISILKAMRSIDVQACPGSGKTTLIATKLILLAKKWNYQHQGICVLSHTNVAKDEIIDRLQRSKSKVAQRLLSYPHFIGTIQEFVHRFLTLPYIRSNGISDITVDNDTYAKQAVKLLELDQFGWFKGTLNGLGNTEKQEAFFRGTFRYISQNGEEININKKPKAWKTDNNFQKAISDLNRLKDYLDKRGIFLFRDMYIQANKACTNNIELAKVIRTRFPFILIDEMQDTQKFQDELLCKIFPFDKSSIIQRLGDPDQSIFNNIGTEEPNQSFNGKLRDQMDYVIQKSHRFDGALSNKSGGLSFNEIPLETELTDASLLERAQAHVAGDKFSHTIIIFNDNTHEKVIEYFSQIVSNQFAEKYKKDKKFTVKVVGAVGAEITPDKDQFRLGHYWPDFDKIKSKTNFKESCFIDAVRHCQQNSSIDLADNYKFLLTCILKIMRMNNVTDDNGRSLSSTTLREYLINAGNWERFRKGLLYLLTDPRAVKPRYWEVACRTLASLLLLENITAEATEYMTFNVVINPNETGTVEQAPTLVSLKDNTIAHVDGFHIELSTIHAVKGETHDATLVIETKNHTFDLQTMLPYLTGKLPNIEYPNSNLPDKPNSRRAFKPNKVFMRQFYVAMSCPRHLLCLALHSDRISDEQTQLLREYGWKIEII
ncbi:UvrD-helicase domain-containing protein [Photorhabdus africana]|uniref:UvrD-helicase domain-containing protein n=1 Tax=Photorhabdus africana TaxID=3097554 RepID=UPI002B414723|nr:UvrD-helicase domain-containing protein [Photorhabdus sp. CRI-LC]